jgi:outer membrane protein assembly factor BamD
MRNISVMLIFLFFQSFSACSSNQPQVKYADLAQELYEQGMSAFKDEDFLTALQKFRDVKNKFLYSTYAPLSELMIGDTFLAQAQYLEAIDAYQNFIQNRPNHPSVSNAYWRIALSYYQQKPKPSIILPPSYEKDRTPVEEAIRALHQYIDLYPKGEFFEKAQTYLKDCRKDLLDYELYVARFYKRLKKYHSAQGRYEGIMSKFDDIEDLWATSLLELIEVLEKQDKKAEIIAVVQRLSKALPNAAQTKEAQEKLKQVQVQSGETKSN